MTTPSFLSACGFHPSDPLAWCALGQNLPAVQKTWAPSLGREDSLQEEMATLSSSLAWETPRTEEPDGHSPWGHRDSDITE